MSYNEENNYGRDSERDSSRDERFSNRRPARRDFRDRPRTEIDLKLNGPHKAFNDINCENECGKTILKDESFYFVNLRGEERARKMCPDCARSKVV